MPSRKVQHEQHYLVAIDGQIVGGTARKILDGIRRNARPDSSLRKLTLDQYVSALVMDADYFIPLQTLKFLQRQRYASPYDRALRYLAAQLDSGVLILAEAEPAKVSSMLREVKAS